MKKPMFTDGQFLAVLLQAEAGITSNQRLNMAA